MSAVLKILSSRHTTHRVVLTVHYITTTELLRSVLHNGARDDHFRPFLFSALFLGTHQAKIALSTFWPELAQ